MASEGKHSPFTFKKIALSMVGVFFSSWAVPKVLDYFLDTTFLTTMSDWLLGVWNWLLQEQPQPNWLLITFAILSLLLCYTAYRLLCLYSSALDRADKAEQAAAAPKNPSQPLSKLQTKIMWCFAHIANTGERFQGSSFSSYAQLGRLELETGIDQLVEKGLLKWTVYNSLTGGRTPSLTLKGKESALEIYSATPPAPVPPTPKPRISDLKPQQDRN